MNSYFYLSIAIISEVIATTLLPVTLGFTRILPSLGCAIGYASAFYFLSLATANIPTAVVYAIWCGAGIVLIALIGAIRGDIPNMDTIFGMILIIIGVSLINMNTKAIC
ncbi:QacE family quaternary ammonium compound efflux SMR transporter [Shewanella psychropiezotolerans]|uniref:QacE family quaternary ammonium compound efflux SMR transporter n=1 Tax=Shewanella psychropiezotolerans TaxID=2593655 RepID=A0ABX5X0V2_9GAMM|nr:MULTISPECIES: SMR family transporter [Shewanella]MPY21373.1 QacE family quaternary ammonium compound efflux SMR transporter [Shewanella sp. YLB-07]MPY22160.1 QacE family quaternary ammonium compound efflux SMR transporter [Shewanella sp. YLB-07]QDO84987.1 QacE family quaternary ammonium compound efflux SMR transporter [Shewanella psychropiezotolerans]